MISLDEFRNFLDLESGKNHLQYMPASFTLKVFACASTGAPQRLDKMGTKQIARRFSEGATHLEFEEYVHVLGMDHLSKADLAAMMNERRCEVVTQSVILARTALKAARFNRPDLVRLLMAALMATFGLGSNNVAAIYGAFLVSPLMKPIVQVVFKVIHTAYMMKFWAGNRTEDQFGGTILDSFLTFFLAIFLNYVVGFVGGFILM